MRGHEGGETPMEVKLLTMPGCEHCAGAKAALERLRSEFPGMMLDIIDVTEHPEEAQRYGLMSAPGVVIDGKLVLSGGVDEKKLRARLAASKT